MEYFRFSSYVNNTTCSMIHGPQSRPFCPHVTPNSFLGTSGSEKTGSSGKIIFHPCNMYFNCVKIVKKQLHVRHNHYEFSPLKTFWVVFYLLLSRIHTFIIDFLVLHLFACNFVWGWGTGVAEGTRPFR